MELSGSPFLLWGNVLACALMGMLLNYAQFLCTTVNTALATTIVGVAKGIIAVILGAQTEARIAKRLQAVTSGTRRRRITCVVIASAFCFVWDHVFLCRLLPSRWRAG